MNRFSRYAVLMGALVCAVLVLGSVAGAATLQEIKDRGVLKTATVDFESSPFTFTKDGALVGLDVDLINLIAEKIGVKSEIVRVPWDGGMTLCWDPAYTWDKFDLGVGSITIKDSRAAVCDFSEWYVTTGQMLLVRSDSGYASQADLKDKKIACMTGSTGEDAAKANFPAENLVLFPAFESVVAAVLDKTADAAVYDGPQILVLAKTDSNFKVLEDLLTKERYGVAMPKGSDLRAVVDEVVKAQRKDLYNKWMK